MQVVATINGFANSSNAGAAFAVNMVAENKRENDRAIPLKPMTINAAELAAAIYACKAVHPEHTPLTDFILRTCNPYLLAIAERKDKTWKAEPKTNIDLVNSLREGLNRFKSFAVQLDKDSEAMTNLKSKARSFQK